MDSAVVCDMCGWMRKSELQRDRPREREREWQEEQQSSRKRSSAATTADGVSREGGREGAAGTATYFDECVSVCKTR